MGALTLASPFFLRESYGPVILARKAKRLRIETGNQELKSRLDPGIPTHNFIRRAFSRPIKFLFTSPTILLLSIYVATIYGYEYLVFSTLSFVYQDQYHFSTAKTGLTYLGTDIGTILGECE